jgi:glycosyltransferase involved in cell wall biosynthesis
MKNRLAIISKSDSSGGGAGVVAEDLHHLINTTAQYSSHLWYGFGNKPVLKDAYQLYGNKSGRLVYKSFRYLSRKLGIPDFIPTEFAFHLLKMPGEYDLYHFHSISSAISPITLRWLSRRYPTVWTFHDCSPFTGGCIYPTISDCAAFTSRCGNCPQLNVWPMLSQLDLTGPIQDYKRKTIKDNLISVVVPSKWMANEALKSGFFSKEPIVIPNCVDMTIFKFRNKKDARQKLNLPEDGLIVLMGAASLDDKRKGIEYAIKALKKLSMKPCVIAIGNDASSLEHQNIISRYTGFINDKSDLALYYSAADIFLFPTLADNFPLTVIESMACGTPVIGFAVGGLPEIVDHDCNGWLVPLMDIEGLVVGLTFANNDVDRLRHWSINGLLKVSELYQPSKFLDRHLSLYDSLLNK